VTAIFLGVAVGSSMFRLRQDRRVFGRRVFGSLGTFDRLIAWRRCKIQAEGKLGPYLRHLTESCACGVVATLGGPPAAVSGQPPTLIRR